MYDDPSLFETWTPAVESSAVFNVDEGYSPLSGVSLQSESSGFSWDRLIDTLGRVGITGLQTYSQYLAKKDMKGAVPSIQGQGTTYYTGYPVYRTSQTGLPAQLKTVSTESKRDEISDFSPYLIFGIIGILVLLAVRK